MPLPDLVAHVADLATQVQGGGEVSARLLKVAEHVVGYAKFMQSARFALPVIELIMQLEHSRELRARSIVVSSQLTIDFRDPVKDMGLAVPMPEFATQFKRGGELRARVFESTECERDCAAPGASIGLPAQVANLAVQPLGADELGLCTIVVAEVEQMAAQPGTQRGLGRFQFGQMPRSFGECKALPKRTALRQQVGRRDEQL